MPSDPFPELPDANRLFARNGEINAALPFSRLKRFSDCLSDPEGQVDVVLNFDLDEEGRRRLSGSLDAVATLLCQRCLQPLQVELHSSLKLLFVDSEAEVKQASHTDADDVIVDKGESPDVLAIIEDELILSLPLAPVHEKDSCNTALNALRQETTAEKLGENSKDENRKQNPFAILATLKQKTDKNGNGKL
jgi:uncharacterized protein